MSTKNKFSNTRNIVEYRMKHSELGEKIFISGGTSRILFRNIYLFIFLLISN
jgi:hypothetical protein